MLQALGIMPADSPKHHVGRYYRPPLQLTSHSQTSGTNELLQKPIGSSQYVCVQRESVKQAEPRRRWEETVFWLRCFKLSPLSRFSLDKVKGWGGMDEASAWWADEIHPISTGDEVSST